MSGTIYRCGEERRRIRVASASAPPGLTGIDYVEVDPGPPLRLIVELVKPVALAPGDVTDAIVRLTGGERLPAPRGTVAADPSPAASARLIITFPLGADTDFSTYTLTLVRGPDDPRPPAFIDPRLATVDFSFKVDCPDDSDCGPDCPPLPDPPADPPFDYTARDYQGLRRLMLDRLATLLPNFGSDHSADFATTLVEALAYDADQASYRLDWVGTEAFLGTARARSSLRRHARLVDYVIGEGASARCFVAVDFTPGVGLAGEGMLLAAGTPFLPRSAGLPTTLGPTLYRDVLAGTPIVFEVMATTPLWSWRNKIDFHSWGDDFCVLCAGATAATLIDTSGGSGGLAEGDLLLLQETRSPETGHHADARRDHRQVVRLTRVSPTADPLAPALNLIDVAWDAADALRFDLALEVALPDAVSSAPGVPGAVARANLLLADHGASLPPGAALGFTAVESEALRPTLLPPVPPEQTRWSPQVVLPGSLALPLARIAPPPDAAAPAARAIAFAPAAALPALALDDDFEPWTALPDLLASDPFARAFVVETDIDGNPVLRFGDGVNGLAPAPGAALGVHGRFGAGIVGNLGADALAHVVLPATQATATLRVTNPLPAVGGSDDESVASIRARAPEAFRVQDRAVTAADYAAFARRRPGVADAIALPRWTGAWWTMMVYFDRTGGLPADAGFRADVATGLERYRMMGFDIALAPAQPAPLDIALEVCALPDALRTTVAAAVRRVLSPFIGGAAAFFHPDRFGFGADLQLSRLIAAVMAVPGVQSVRPITFRRWARAPAGELAGGVIRPTGSEILCLDDDPSRPERGRLELQMGGGR